jgi:hypothetical protein
MKNTGLLTRRSGIGRPIACHLGWYSSVSQFKMLRVALIKTRSDNRGNYYLNKKL